MHTGGVGFAAVIRRREPLRPSGQGGGVPGGNPALAPWAERDDKEHGAISALGDRT